MWPIHSQGHGVTVMISLQRLLLIWRLIHVSLQLIAIVQKKFRTRGTLRCATMSRRGGLCQLTTQSAPILVVRHGLI
jgi:hypothetical protein